MSTPIIIAANRLNRVAFGIGLALTALPAHAEAVQGEAEVTVVRPLSFVIDDNLDFGSLLPSNVAGTVTLTPAGARTATNGIVLVGTGFKPASFAGRGAFNQRVDVSLGSNSIFITGPGTRMRVSNFVIGSTPTAVLTTAPRRFRIASTTGVFGFPVGATLDVGANQAPGTYSGTWSITLNYF